MLFLPFYSSSAPACPHGRRSDDDEKKGAQKNKAPNLAEEPMANHNPKPKQHSEQLFRFLPFLWHSGETPFFFGYGQIGQLVFFFLFLLSRYFVASSLIVMDGVTVRGVSLAP